MDEFLKVLRMIRIEIDPLEFDNGICIHPFRGNFCIEAKLLNFNGSELIKIFGGAGIQKHSNFSMRSEEMLVLQYFDSLYFFIGLSLLIYLIVLVLHLFRPVGHLYHDLFEVLHLHLTDPVHRIGVVLLLLLVS